MHSLIAFILVNTISAHPEEQHLPFKQTPSFFQLDTIPVLGHFLIHSVDKTHDLVVTLELIWLLLLNILSFNFVPTPKKSLLSWQDSKETM